MNRIILSLLILTLVTPALGQVPTYQLDCILPAPGCTSVDMCPDGTKLCARMTYGGWDEGYRIFDIDTIDICDSTILNDCGGHWAPWRGLFSADCAYLYTTVYYGGWVKKIDISDCSIAKAIDLGSWTVGLAFDSQRRYLYVGENCPGGSVVTGSLKVIDTNTDTVVCSVPLDGQPGFNIVVDPDDEFVYLVSQNPGTATLYKICTAPDCGVEDTLALPSGVVGLLHAGISVSPDGDSVYVPYHNANLVYVINTATLSIVDSWSIDCPESFFISPDGTHALVTSRNCADIRVFDLSSESVVQTIPVNAPHPGEYKHWAEPCWDASKGKVYLNIPGSEGGVAVLSAALSCAVDIKPGSCPNPLNVDGKGVLPVAVLGSEGFDVTTIDPVSVRLTGVAPICSGLEDVATPLVDANECECTTAGPDGHIDLALKFKTQDIVEELVKTQGEPAQSDVLSLILEGALYDGTLIEGADCVVIVGKVPKPIHVRISDVNEDGVVNMLDFVMLAGNWLESTVLQD